MKIIKGKLTAPLTSAYEAQTLTLQQKERYARAHSFRVGLCIGSAATAIGFFVYIYIIK